MAVCNEFSKVEEKLLKKMLEGNLDIQLIASDGDNSFVCMGQTRIEPTILLLCIISPENVVCNGAIGDRKISLLYENENAKLQKWNEEIRLIIDRRVSNERCFHVYSEETFSKFNEMDEFNERSIIIAYIEQKNFAQLSIFNSELQQKISDIVTKNESLIPDFRTNAFTLISSIYPSFKSYLQEEVELEENRD